MRSRMSEPADPKPSKLAINLALRKKVEQDLQRRYSPEQIAGRLRRKFPGRPEMWVSTETILSGRGRLSGDRAFSSQAAARVLLPVAVAQDVAVHQLPSSGR